MNEEKLVVELEKEKETKRTIRYAITADSEDGIDTVYIQKRALQRAFGHIPDKITITVTAK